MTGDEMLGTGARGGFIFLFKRKALLALPPQLSGEEAESPALASNLSPPTRRLSNRCPLPGSRCRLLFSHWQHQRPAARGRRRPPCWVLTGGSSNYTQSLPGVNIAARLALTNIQTGSDGTFSQLKIARGEEKNTL